MRASGVSEEGRGWRCVRPLCAQTRRDGRWRQARRASKRPVRRHPSFLGSTCVKRPSLTDPLPWLSTTALSRLNSLGVIALTQLVTWRWFLHAKPSHDGAPLWSVVVEFIIIGVTLLFGIAQLR